MELSYEVFKPGQINAKNGMYPKTLSFDPDNTGPLVSCVMVTRGNPGLVARSARCFVAQTWRDRELVVVTDKPVLVEKTLAPLLNPSLYRVVPVPAGLTLGDYRNLSIAHSEGEYICQWDDDDVYHPDRISAGMKTLLFTSSAAVFLSQWTMVWPERSLACVSESRVWEGSMVARRDAVPVYPSMSRCEDTEMVDMLCRHHQITLLNYPKLYFYTVTGQNTNTDDHFSRLFDQATLRYDYEGFCATVKKELGVDFGYGDCSARGQPESIGEDGDAVEAIPGREGGADGGGEPGRDVGHD